MLLVPSSGCMEKMKYIIYEFIWKNESQIKRKVINQDVAFIGCKMIDIIVQAKALKLSWTHGSLKTVIFFVCVQCAKGALHFPIEHIILGNLKIKHEKMYGQLSKHFQVWSVAILVLTKRQGKMFTFKDVEAQLYGLILTLNISNFFHVHPPIKQVTMRNLDTDLIVPIFAQFNVM